MPIAYRTFAFVAVLGALWALPAQATVVVIPEFPELVGKVDVIAHAKVLEQRTVSEGGRIWTLTTLKVADGLKGAKLDETLVVHQLGGLMGDRQMWIPGAHRFEVGEELMFFGMRFTKGGAEAVIPFGVGYGVFDVTSDEMGRVVVREVIGAVAAYKKNPDGTRTPFTPTPRTWTSVDAFKDEVRGLLTQEKAGVRFTPPQVKKLTPKASGGAR